jgi:signal transduction histidine kinase
VGSETNVAEASDNLTISLAYLPPTLAQRRFALFVVVLQFVACAVVAPIPVQLPRIDSFVPVILGIVFVAYLITAVMLFGQSAIIASRAVLVLANGYLFSALIVIPHALTFPGAFTPEGLLGAGVQSSGWLNVFWHFGFLVAVAGYACWKDRKQRTDVVPTSVLPTFLWSLTIQISLICALTWAVIAGDRFMPRLFLDDLSYAPLVHYAAGTLVLIAALVLLPMWSRRTSALDLWIIVALCMLISEMALVALGLTARFYVGWYVSRALAVAVSAVVLIAMLSESIRLQASLSRTNIMLERERGNRLLNVQAAVSAIIHEVRQPLTAIAANTAAARKLLAKTPPDLGIAIEAIDDIESADFRMNEVLAHVRKLFQDVDQEHHAINLNDLALETLQILRRELNGHGVRAELELESELPLVMGRRVQLQEVIINLIHNAIDSMDSIHVGGRMLKVKTKSDGTEAIVLAVEDSGPGIDPKRLKKIFEAFVTTKSNGTGLGLAICSRIIERHGGRIAASSDGKSGALFQVFLPTAQANSGGSRTH